MIAGGPTAQGPVQARRLEDLLVAGLQEPGSVRELVPCGTRSTVRARPRRRRPITASRPATRPQATRSSSPPGRKGGRAALPRPALGSIWPSSVRRAFLARTGGLAAASWLGEVVGDAPAAVDPRLRSLARAVGAGDHAGRRGVRPRAARLQRALRPLHPLGIFQPLSVAMCVSVGLVPRTGVRLAVRSGGHSYAGYSTTTGLVVDLAAAARDRRSTGPRHRHGRRRRAAGRRRGGAGRARPRDPGGLVRRLSASAGWRSAAASGSLARRSGRRATTSSRCGIVTADGRTGSAASRAPRGPVLGLPRRRRRELRDRHALRPAHPRVDRSRTSSPRGRGRRRSRRCAPGRRSRRTRSTGCSRSARSRPARRPRSARSGSSSAARRSSARCSRRSRGRRPAPDDRHVVVPRRAAPLGRLPREDGGRVPSGRRAPGGTPAARASRPSPTT